MSLAIVHSRGLSGMHAPEVTVEVHLANGLPGFTLVGLPEAEVKEARERVRAAIQNNGFEFPARRITVNLAPADLPKESGRFDLPIALGILAASGQIAAQALGDFEFAGELSLSGGLRPVRGALAMAYAVARAARGGRLRGFILPAADADEAALVGSIPVFPASHLAEVIAHLAHAAGDAAAPALVQHTASARLERPAYPDLADIKGQAAGKRALEIAAAGGHSLLLAGPPGTGKTLLAQRLPGILPAMATDEALESAAVLSLAGRFSPQRWGERPFRAPHHSASPVALVGGGNPPQPGEISLADRGVLFLDELPEFERRVPEALREPLESGQVAIARAGRHVSFPARFQLVAAMNPCPCGWLGDPRHACRCTPDQIARYQQRLSGPLLDRIDMRVEMPALSEDELLAQPAGEASATVLARVEAARARALSRQGKPNAELAGIEVEHTCRPEGAVRQLLHTASQRLGWSARAYHRVLRLARSIADLAGDDELGTAHVAEAIQLRRGLASLD